MPENEEFKIGPTGEYSEGKLSPGDKGGLAAALYIKNGKIIIDFGTELTWIAMGKAQAIAFGTSVVKFAERLPD